ncbi:Threonine aldolase [Coemansia sp. RSA 2711]|nr:Threonine aldolase [Coemansia sp. RSA 2711]KAJ2316241.1 Threonine aldolase [Coemansia sp. RSA 2704]KAJ2721601.1 Threonine aldolase [Coemansia sp. Cherry 401B]
MAHNWDLRSDTVTKPTADMLAAMLGAPVGDSVFGEDPTVTELERRAAELCGKEAAIFCASSTMGNQLAIRAHLHNPPESIVCHAKSHIFQYESGGAALLSQAMMVPVTPSDSINLTAADVKQHLILDNFLYHKPPTRLVALENTFSGVVMPLKDIEEIAELAHSHGIPVHLDGSRLWNASVATGISLAEYTRQMDSVNLCLSKGMGCPVGAVLVGSAAFIDKARHFRKVFGGGWRQAGILAAAGLYAIDHIWPTMKRSHEQARRLADGLTALGFAVSLPVETNMVLLSIDAEMGVACQQLVDVLKEKGVTMGVLYEGSLRLVVHHQIDDECIDLILASARQQLAT